MTIREQESVSELKHEVSQLNKTVMTLVQKFALFEDFKNSYNTDKVTLVENSSVTNVGKNTSPNTKALVVDDIGKNPVTKETDSTKNLNPTSLVIKANGKSVDFDKFKEIALSNNIQVKKSVVNANGDVFVNLPNAETKNKLEKLLSGDVFAQNSVVTVKSNLPSISILDVVEFESKEDFIEKVKSRNAKINELIENGSEFSIIFSKGPKEDAKYNTHQVVARVSEDIRDAIRLANNRIYIELTSHRVVDRFYVKRCNKCCKFGHYEKDCTESVCCGYCHGEHLSKDCTTVKPGELLNYECKNCLDSGKNAKGHSAMWPKCPTYLEAQERKKKVIPYYQKN